MSELFELVLIDEKGREKARALHLHSREEAEELAKSWNQKRELQLKAMASLVGRWQVTALKEGKR